VPVFNLFELKRCALKGCSKELDPEKVLFNKQKYCCRKHQQFANEPKKTWSKNPKICRTGYKRAQFRESRRPKDSHRNTVQKRLIKERVEEVKKEGDKESLFYENKD